MIVCVTLNPCLDKTLVVGPWKPGDNARGRALSAVVGGKGNNVARALRRLGRQARPATFLGGNVGERCAELLRAEGFDPVVIPSRAETRVILTVRTEPPDATPATAFFDPDPAIPAAEAAEMIERVGQLLRSGTTRALTLSGSSPARAADRVYVELIAIARSAGVPVFLDTYGLALRAADRAPVVPDVVQMNRAEAAGHLDRAADQLTDRELIDWMTRREADGVRLLVVTDGPRPTLARANGRTWRADPPPIDVVNPIGCGDCLLAGLVDAWLDAPPDPEILLRRGIACATANAMVWDAGAIDPETVARCAPRVRVRVEPADR